MKKMLLISLAFAVATAFAAPNKVKSKRGDVDLMSGKGEGKVVCTAGFNDELTVVKKEDTFALVKGNCGQGWIENSKVEYVVQAEGDKSMKLEGIDVVGWLDNPSAVFVLDQDAADFDGINIDRDFKDYLQHTMDREQTEMRNKEN